MLVTSGLYLVSSNDADKPCIEEWFGQTKEVFANASSLFQKSDNELLIETEEESLDLKLEALLPDSEFNLPNQPNLKPKLEPSISDTALLPDLFNQAEENTAKFKGQVHTDENDNIIGAEVHVAIPTDIN